MLSKAPPAVNIVRHLNLVHNRAFINGEWVSAKSKKTFNVLNPATGGIIGNVPDCEIEDMEIAIKSAHAAFPSWSNNTAKDRSKILRTFSAELLKNISDVAKLVTLESGKPIGESIAEVNSGVSHLEWFSEQARRIEGEIFQSPIKGTAMLSVKEPIGVTALVSPWNFPLGMILRKLSAALAAGCTTIIKPSSDTPLTALAIADIATKSGIPNGVINVITNENPKEIVKLLCDSPFVSGLSFTGSTQVGKILYSQCAKTVKRISLELGGNAPFIIFESADIDRAVEGGFSSKFRNCGQTCVCANRFFIHENVFNTFVEKMKKKVDSLKLGNGLVPGVNMGPLINVKQARRVEELVQDAIKKGANVVCGGTPAKEIGECFYRPTILTNITPNMSCYTEEIFGPILVCIKFQNEDEVIQMSNDTRSGLAGYFYSNDLQQIYRVIKKMEVGMVGINVGLLSSVEAPFGGVKESGIGRESSHYGIEEFVNVKYVCLGNL